SFFRWGCDWKRRCQSLSVVLLTPAATVAATVISVVISVVIMMLSLFRDEVGTSESRPLNLIHGVFPLTELMQLFHLVPSKAGRQCLKCSICPRSAVSRSPEPVFAVQVIVAAADKIDVIRNAHRDIHLRLGHQHHRWRGVHND